MNLNLKDYLIALLCLIIIVLTFLFRFEMDKNKVYIEKISLLTSDIDMQNTAYDNLNKQSLAQANLIKEATLKAETQMNIVKKNSAVILQENVSPKCDDAMQWLAKQAVMLNQA